MTEIYCIYQPMSTISVIMKIMSVIARGAPLYPKPREALAPLIEHQKGLAPITRSQP